jgi:hypothetical protein
VLDAGHFEIFASISTLLITLHRLQVWRVKKMHKENKQMLTKLVIEHEIILQDYCDRKGISREHLPTRQRSILGNGE